MANENAFWATLRKKMQGRWRAQRFEDKLSEGIPDHCFAFRGMSGIGFIELKRLTAWPVRETTIVRIPHYTPLQRAWIRRFGEFSGRVFLFLQVDREYLLFDWKGAQKVGEVTRQELCMLAAGWWARSINADELQEILEIGFYDNV